MDQLVYGSSSDDSDNSDDASADGDNSSANSEDSSSEEDEHEKTAEVPTSNILPSALDALQNSKSFIARAEAAAAVSKKETTVNRQ